MKAILEEALEGQQITTIDWIPLRLNEPGGTHLLMITLLNGRRVVLDVTKATVDRPNGFTYWPYSGLAEGAPAGTGGVR